MRDINELIGIMEGINLKRRIFFTDSLLSCKFNK